MRQRLKGISSPGAQGRGVGESRTAEWARTRDEVWMIFLLIELKMEEYRSHVKGKSNERLEELVKGKMIDYGRHAGSYRRVKYVHRTLFGYYLAKFRKYRDGWEFILG